jgi:hypothetical protein
MRCTICGIEIPAELVPQATFGCCPRDTAIVSADADCRARFCGKQGPCPAGVLTWLNRRRESLGLPTDVFRRLTPYHVPEMPKPVPAPPAPKPVAVMPAQKPAQASVKPQVAAQPPRKKQSHGSQHVKHDEIGLAMRIVDFIERHYGGINKWFRLRDLRRQLHANRYPNTWQLAINALKWAKDWQEKTDPDGTRWARLVDFNLSARVSEAEARENQKQRRKAARGRRPQTKAYRDFVERKRGRELRGGDPEMVRFKIETPEQAYQADQDRKAAATGQASPEERSGVPFPDCSNEQGGHLEGQEGVDGPGGQESDDIPENLHPEEWRRRWLAKCEENERKERELRGEPDPYRWLPDFIPR